MPDKLKELPEKSYSVMHKLWKATTTLLVLTAAFIITLMPAPTKATGTVPDPGPKLGPRKLKKLVRSVGFRKESAKIAWALAMRESGGYYQIVSQPNTNGTRDWGLFQFNDVHRSWLDFQYILDPGYNTTAAWNLSKQGTDFSAWGIGDQGYAGYLKKTSPQTYKLIQERLNAYIIQYPPKKA